MEKVGQDSVSDISETNKATVNFSYSISVKEFRARYQKLGVGRFSQHLIGDLHCKLIILKLSVHAKCSCTFQKSTLYIPTKIAFKQLTQCI